MNMMQSIYNIYWHILLKHMKKWLKIERLSKDVRGCYFEASRLIVYCNRKFSCYMWHLFITRNYSRYQPELLFCDEVDVVTMIAQEFEQYLAHHHEKTTEVDEHLKMLNGFIIMVNGFRNFVDSYRCQDIVGVEHGYSSYAPVWKCNGQS